MTKMAKIDTQFMAKTAEKPWGRTYLYSPYKGVPPGPEITYNLERQR